MSVDVNTYIGPYLVVAIEKKTTSKVVDACKNPKDCPNSKSEFCPKCGVPIRTRVSCCLVDNTPSIHDILENIDELNCEKGRRSHRDLRFKPVHFEDYDPFGEDDKNDVYVLISDDSEFDKSFSRSTVLETYDVRLEEWSGIDPHAEIQAFAKCFEKDIAELVKRGCVIRGTCWGLIQWCS
jgi:hypothetical protein